MNNLTIATKEKQIKRNWHEIDAKGKILGRVASEAAVLLMGKAKPYYVANLDCGDYVIVININDIKVTGKKLIQKIYTSYSGYPHGIRREALRDMLVRKPEEVMNRAIAGMLPKNKLRDQLLKRLFPIVGSEHKYKDKLKK